MEDVQLGIILLKDHRRQETRHLYETVFLEDSKRFVDYYYESVADHNQIWIKEQKLDTELEEQNGVEYSTELMSMLHLNPYQVKVGNRRCKVNYMVAVATAEQHRRKGYMGELLRASFQQMYEEEMPFTYLMPVAEAIYIPYDFVTVSGQKLYEYQGQMFGMEFEKVAPQVSQRYASESDCKELAAFANEQFSPKYSCYTYRTEAYFKQLIKEQESQNGGIVIAIENEKIVGYFCVADEGDIVIREPVFSKGYELPLKVMERPKIMTRIIHLESMLRCMNAQEGMRTQLEIFDPLIKQNTGVYSIERKNGQTYCEKMSNQVDMKSAIAISDLTKMVFAQESIFLNEIV